MTDPYLRALDDVASELRRQRGRAPAEPALAEDRVEWDAAARW